MIILVVEDDVDHNLVLTSLIRKECKAEVIACFSLETAKTVLRENIVRAVVCDFFLNDGTAEELFSFLGENKSDASIVVYANHSVDLSKFKSPKFLGVVTKDNPREVCKKILSIKD